MMYIMHDMFLFSQSDLEGIADKKGLCYAIVEKSDVTSVPASQIADILTLCLGVSHKMNVIYTGKKIQIK